MNIKNIHLEIIHSDMSTLDVDLKVTECKSLDQETIRAMVANSLSQGQENRQKSISFSDLGCRNTDFPLEGVAKIMVQEIMSYSRKHKKPSLEKIVFCIEEEGSFRIFDKTIRGYVKHIQE